MGLAAAIVVEAKAVVVVSIRNLPWDSTSVCINKCKKYFLLH